MPDGSTSEVSLSMTKEQDSIASSLSLIPNKPDRNGRNLFQLEGERLERNRLLWEETESNIGVGEKVLIKPGTPVGLGPKGYIAEVQIEGTFMGSVDFGLYGGQGYMQRGSRRKSPYVRVGVEVTDDKSGVPMRTSLTVPNDMLEAVPEELATTAPDG